MRQLFALGRQMVFVIDGNLVEYRYSRNQCRRRALWHSFLYSRGRLVRAYAFDLTLWAGARRLSSNREQRVRSTDHMVFLLIDDSLPTSQHYEGNPIPGESIIRTHPWSKSILGPPSPRFFSTPVSRSSSMRSIYPLVTPTSPPLCPVTDPPSATHPLPLSPLHRTRDTNDDPSSMADTTRSRSMILDEQTLLTNLYIHTHALGIAKTK